MLTSRNVLLVMVASMVLLVFVLTVDRPGTRRQWRARTIRTTAWVEVASVSPPTDLPATDLPVVVPASTVPSEQPATQKTHQKSMPDARKRRIHQASFNRTLPGVNFIRDRLVAKIGSQIAARETEEDILGDRWFWIDDNAKSMEVFIMPGVYEEYKETTDSMVDFILDMSRDGLFLRRKSQNKVGIKSKNMTDFSISNGVMDYFGNANALVVRQGYRFHDGRGTPATHTAGFEVSFTCDGETYRSPVDFNGMDKTIDETDGQVVVKAVMQIAGKAEVEWRFVMRADTVVAYTYVDVRNIQKQPLQNVVVRVKRALDEQPYSRFCRKYAGKAVKCIPAKGGKGVVPAKEIEWFSFSVQGKMGFSYGWHHIAKDKSLTEIILQTEGSLIKSFTTVFGRETLLENEVFNVEDLGMLTAGGLYKTMPYDTLLKTIESRKELTDFSISYDYGAELSSMSSYAYFLKHRMYDISDEEQEKKSEEINKWCLLHLEAYYKNFILTPEGGVDKTYAEVFQRGNSMTILAVIKLALINRHDKETLHVLVHILNVLVECLLAFQQDSGFITCELGGGHYLDCHGAGMLALSYIVSTHDVLPYKVTKAVVLERYARAVESIEYKLGASVTDYERQNVRLEVVVTSPRGEDGMQWNYKASLILRALHVMELAAADGDKIPTAVEEKGTTLRQYMRGLIEHSRKVSSHNGMPYHEFTTSYSSPETNSETQPWCMLGYHGAYEELYYKLFHDTELAELQSDANKAQS